MKMFPVEFSAGNDSIILFFHLAVAIIFLICCGIAAIILETFFGSFKNINFAH